MDHKASLRGVKKTLAQGHMVDKHPSQLSMEGPKGLINKEGQPGS